MSEEILLRNCAPTLAGLKTGNIFGCAYADENALRESLRGWNRRLLQKGLRVVPLQYCGGRALLYVYRPRRRRSGKKTVCTLQEMHRRLLRQAQKGAHGGAAYRFRT